MEISNYEFVSLDIETTETTEERSKETEHDYPLECQLMLHEYLYELPTTKEIPISIIRSCLKQIEN